MDLVSLGLSNGMLRSVRIELLNGMLRSVRMELLKGEMKKGNSWIGMDLVCWVNKNGAVQMVRKKQGTHGTE